LTDEVDLDRRQSAGIRGLTDRTTHRCPELLVADDPTGKFKLTWHARDVVVQIYVGCRNGDLLNSLTPR